VKRKNYSLYKNKSKRNPIIKDENKSLKEKGKI
jgi:hypothetical protein